MGKRKFERALEQFAHKDGVQIIWHSFQLDPTLKTQPEMNAYDYLAKIKGITREESVQMHGHVTEVASEAGLSFNVDKTVVANSYNGHRLIQMAKARGVGDEAEEQLFKAHFTDGKNIDDPEVLTAIGTSIGLDENDVRILLAGSAYSQEVNDDEQMARTLGIRGVPFFVFNNKFAVSGAQSPEVFLQTLNRAWEEQVAFTPHSKDINRRFDQE